MVQVDITEADFPGCYFITVEDDPEHALSTTVVSLQEAEDLADEIREQWEIDNGQFGVGS